ncbi:hypothetical protein EU546_08470 [Candidatus Thorarchaeota archaeon]|nr:MAG: hypothetical protein EU546_08470 [Candidatus Thorarchaeota archaeon]
MTSVTSDETYTDDEEMRTRMRQRFHEMDERRKKERKARMAWPFVMWFGLVIVIGGVLVGLLGMGIIALSLPLLLSVGIIVFGMLLVAVALFLKSNPDVVAEEA